MRKKYVRIGNNLKNFYRYSKWYLINILSLGNAAKIYYISPFEIKVGQTPESQFLPQNTFRFIRSGDWDRQVIPVDEHLMYVSFYERFLENKPWSETLFYNYALEKIKNGESYRQEYHSEEQLKVRFNRCDRLFREIKENGFKSNKQLYELGQIASILHRLDEITINISRDGSIILNDGWHRFTIARLLKISKIPVRLVVTHSLCKAGDNNTLMR